VSLGDTRQCSLSAVAVWRCRHSAVATQPHSPDYDYGRHLLLCNPHSQHSVGQCIPFIQARLSSRMLLYHYEDTQEIRRGPIYAYEDKGRLLLLVVLLLLWWEVGRGTWDVGGEQESCQPASICCGLGLRMFGA
jgi:hypothetical protein